MPCDEFMPLRTAYLDGQVFFDGHETPIGRRLVFDCKLFDAIVSFLLCCNLIAVMKIQRAFV